MERRFTVKDFSLFIFLALLATMILLTMYMVDRQWSKMAQIERVMQEQAQSLRELRSLVRGINQQVKSGRITAIADDAVNHPKGPAAMPASENDLPAAFRRARLATEKPDYSEGDWHVQAFALNLKTITPLVSSDVYASAVQGYVLESLLMRDPDTLEWVGMIAKSWQISEDGLTLTFRLRDDVTFSDGQPLTSDDVVFSFDFLMNETIAAPRARAYFEKMKSVTAPDKETAIFEFREPYFNALSLAGSMSIMARHFYEPYLKEPETFNQSKGLLLGSGPYRLQDPREWTPDLGMVELERNPRYWGPILPAFDRLLWKVIENDSARLTTFRNGEIDIYGARPREYKTLLDDAELSARTQHFEYMSPTAGYSYIGWNQRKGDTPTRFADKRVRQAMTYLTDRQRIIDEIMLGYGEIAISPFNPRSHQHDKSLVPRNYDPDKAKALLQAAGYEDRNGDGILEDAAGIPFEFGLVYFQGNEDTKRIVLFLKDLYAGAGILMHPKPTEWSVMLDLLGKRDFDAITLGWSSGVETDIFQMFHGSQTDNGGDNFVGNKNPQLDKLIDEARATVNEATRMPLWQRSEAIMVEDQPYTFLMRRMTMAFIDKRIHNVAQTKLGLNHGFVPLEWYVPLSMQKYGD
ncbi:MAG: ABC transporter substrate-binding protein [Gammaproteobacteria bacterium]|nr:ABC transporter substrate-binding protein [Gammaproteobacteria bacterium]